MAQEVLMPTPMTNRRTFVLAPNLLVVQALECRLRYAICQLSWPLRDRSQLSRWLFLRLDGVVDTRSNNGNGNGFQIAPGLRFDWPIFQSQRRRRNPSDAELLGGHAQPRCDS